MLEWAREENRYGAIELKTQVGDKESPYNAELFYHYIPYINEEYKGGFVCGVDTLPLSLRNLSVFSTAHTNTIRYHNGDGRFEHAHGIRIVPIDVNRAQSLLMGWGHYGNFAELLKHEDWNDLAEPLVSSGLYSRKVDSPAT